MKEVATVAARYANDERIKFHWLDVALNEVPRIVVNELPSLVLFVRGKRKGPIYFQRKLSQKNILAFLKQHTDLPV